MVVTVIHKRQTTVVCGGKGKRKFGGAYGVGLYAYAKYLRLNAGLNKRLVKRLRKNSLD